MADEHKVLGIDPKHERVIVLIASVVTIAGFLLYVRAHTAADTTTASTDQTADTGTSVNSGGTAAPTNDYQSAVDQLRSDQTNALETAIGSVDDNLTNLGNSIIAVNTKVDDNQKTVTDALNTLGQQITTQGTTLDQLNHGTGSIKLDLSVGGSTDTSHAGSWDYDTSGANSSATENSGGQSGSGSFGLSIGGFNLGFGGGGGGSHDDSSANSSSFSNANNGTYDDENSTNFAQTITADASGLTADELYHLTNTLVDVSKRGQTASVNPGSLGAPTSIFTPRNPILTKANPLTNPGKNGYNLAARYNDTTDVGRTNSIDNWLAQTTPLHGG